MAAGITTDKALNLASKLVAASDQLMRALDAFVQLKAEKESSGLDFSDEEFVKALETSSIKHATPELLNSALTNGPAIYKAMVEGGTLQGFTDDSFQALRP